MVAGFAEIAERNELLVAGALYAPNRQFLVIPFRSELIHCIAAPCLTFARQLSTLLARQHGFTGNYPRNNWVSSVIAGNGKRLVAPMTVANASIDRFSLGRQRQRNRIVTNRRIARKNAMLLAAKTALNGGILIEAVNPDSLGDFAQVEDYSGCFEASGISSTDFAQKSHI